VDEPVVLHIVPGELSGTGGGSMGCGGCGGAGAEGQEEGEGESMQEEGFWRIHAIWVGCGLGCSAGGGVSTAGRFWS
jgi:hypothetical protein